MNTKNDSTPTKRYKSLISAVHSVYRLVNSTFEVRDLVSRLARLICQIFNVESCLIMLLDPGKKYSVLKCMVRGNKKYIIDKKAEIKNRIERRIVKKLASVRQDKLLGIPLISEDIA